MTRKNLLAVIEKKNNEINLISKNEVFKKYDKVVLECNKHGKFIKTLNDFAYGIDKLNCKECSKEKLSKQYSLNKEDFEKRLKNKHGNRFKIIKYENYTKYVLVFDKEKEEEIKVFPSNLLKNNYNSKEHNNKKRKKRKEAFLNKFNLLNVDFEIKDISQYNNLHSKIDFICPKHGVFNKRASSVVDDKSFCPRCSWEKNTTGVEKFIIQSKEIHGDKYDYSKVDYFNTNTKVEIMCPKHGSFFQRPKQHKRGEGCPSCNESKGERKIDIFLRKRKQKFSRQKKFEGCENPKTNYKLSFDFYLPEINTCIEYDGEQHYLKNVSGFFTKEIIESIIYRDAIKTKYCKTKNINLLRIEYTDFDNINSVLENLIS